MQSIAINNAIDCINRYLTTDALQILREIRPQADPNPLAVRVWDEFLGMEGRLLAVLDG